ncbi:DNA-binding transcriptional regulator [Pelagicoccus enzymogenes]|uniref:AraC family transcriptional regulator n=1 Tax=Pelagicoccus enzymogenes TaxID=2773457 RepID=UPI00280D1075|nr:DNA-binding transcriptional regulator [Pelagicoccus enzymogenes]MDQ8199853.1 DNA-binding transcriptional regulator [Pelagicoccus enzymogenes]
MKANRPQNKRRYKVALLIETSRAYGRGLLEGVARFTRENPSWSVYFEPSGFGRTTPPWLKDWQGDGILARVSDPATAELLLSRNIPLIDLRGILPDLPVPFVGVDNRSVASLAYQHFRDRGFQSFAIVGAPPAYHPHLDQRCRFFKEQVEQNGYPCATFTDTRLGRPAATWEAQQKRLGKWLKRLPDRTAILCGDDLLARETIDAATRSEISVPESLAVLGVDNDEHLCTLSPTPLSSVATDAAQIGHLAASLLHQMMTSSKKRIPMEQLIASTEVVTRASTDILAIDSPHLPRALRYIRSHACDPISVSQVVAQTSICRSLLEKEFKRHLGRTVFKEILRTKLNHARDLLRHSNRTLEDIADASGFQSAIYLSQVFRRELGLTPGQWRRQNS